MDLKFNKSAEQTMIDIHFKNAMELIKNNLSEGKRITELSFPLEIASDVRNLIDEQVKEQSFEWLIMYKGENQYGKVVNFVSKTIGNERYYKLNYFGD